MTPVTEITSFSTAGSDMPLTSPSERVVGVVVADGDPLRLRPRRRPPPPPPAPPPAVPVVGAPSAQRRTELSGCRDRRDPFLEELVVGVLERDHDLRIVLEGGRFALEGLCRAEGERRRDHSVYLARTKRVVHERVLDDVLETVVK